MGGVVPVGRVPPAPEVAVLVGETVGRLSDASPRVPPVPEVAVLVGEIGAGAVLVLATGTSPPRAIFLTFFLMLFSSVMVFKGCPVGLAQ